MTDLAPTAAPLTREELDRLGIELESLQNLEAVTKLRIDAIKQTFREQLDFGPHIAGNLKVSIQHNVTRDNVAFMAAYPFESYPDFYKPTPDSKVIGHELSKAELERYQVEGDPKVVVTRFEA